MGTSRVSIIEGYRRWAPTYDREPNPLLHLEQRQLERMIPPLDGKRVLDLACGSGRWLGRLKSGGARTVIGLDASPEMLDVARERAGAGGPLVRGYGLSLPFADASFDLVLCSFATGHVADLQGLAGEVGRVCSAGADVFVTDVHPEAYQAGWRTKFRDGGGVVEIATWPRSLPDALGCWTATSFDCLRLIECRFGEPEREVFLKAGKGDVFDEFSRIPAVLICHFQRIPLPRPPQPRPALGRASGAGDDEAED